MELIPFLIGLPVLFAILMALLPAGRVRDLAVYAGAGSVMACMLLFMARWLIGQGARTQFLYLETEWIDHLMTAGDLFLMGLILFVSHRHRRILPALLSVAQTGLLLYVEHTAQLTRDSHMMVDRLTMLMCAIVALVGGFICIYAVGYLKGYHHHHSEVRDRSGFFFAMLFLFLGAMFGLVLSQSLIWMYFFWEITSVISFLLIGYTRSEEAVQNSFRALWMNLFGGLGFSIAIALMARENGS